MLASITPLGERGRQAHWGVTVTAFGLGATAAGAAMGAVLGEAGAAVASGNVGIHARLAALAIAAAAAIALDLRRAPVPGPRRQVDERWLDQYRGWVYGLGFGAQLGAGVTTLVSSAATYVTLVAALVSGGAGRGAMIVGVYGAARGVQPLATARVRTTPRLMRLHALLDRGRTPAARAAVLGLAGICAAALAGSLT